MSDLREKAKALLFDWDQGLPIVPALQRLRAALSDDRVSVPMETIALDRYRAVRTAFWWRVAIGDGQQTVGRCYSETEAQKLAAALCTAFLDGAFLAAAQEQRP